MLPHLACMRLHMPTSASGRSLIEPQPAWQINLFCAPTAYRSNQSNAICSLASLCLTSRAQRHLIVPSSQFVWLSHRVAPNSSSKTTPSIEISPVIQLFLPHQPSCLRGHAVRQPRGLPSQLLTWPIETTCRHLAHAVRGTV